MTSFNLFCHDYVSVHIAPHLAPSCAYLLIEIRVSEQTLFQEEHCVLYLFDGTAFPHALSSIHGCFVKTYSMIFSVIAISHINLLSFVYSSFHLASGVSEPLQSITHRKPQPQLCFW